MAEIACKDCYGCSDSAVNSSSSGTGMTTGMIAVKSLSASVALEGVYTGRIKVGITLVIGVNGFSV